MNNDQNKGYNGAVGSVRAGRVRVEYSISPVKFSSSDLFESVVGRKITSKIWEFRLKRNKAEISPIQNPQRWPNGKNGSYAQNRLPLRDFSNITVSSLLMSHLKFLDFHISAKPRPFELTPKVRGSFAWIGKLLGRHSVSSNDEKYSFSDKRVHSGTWWRIVDESEQSAGWLATRPRRE